MPAFGQAAKFNPSALSPQDRLMLLGATLRDTGGALRGDNSDALLQTQALMAARQQEAAKQQFGQLLSQRLQGSPAQYAAQPAPEVATAAPTDAAPVDGVNFGMFGKAAPAPHSTAANYQYQPPVKTADAVAPLDINSPDLPGIALAAKNAGVDLGTMIEVLKAQQPDIAVAPDGTTYNKRSGAVPPRFATPTTINGWNVDAGAPKNIGQYFTKLPDGVQPDGKGGVGNATGLTTALADQEEAQTRGRTFGTVFNDPNGEGSTTPRLGRDIFAPRQATESGLAPGAPPAQHRTLNPGEIKAQEVDFSNGAQTVASAGDARIKATNTAQQYTQAFNDASALNTNDLTSFKLGTAKILRSLGVQNPDLEQFTNTAEGYRMLATQMVLPLAKELGSNPSNRDAKIIQDSMPGLKTPRQTAMVTFASQAALQNKEAARQQFFASYEGPQSKAAMQRAWSNSEEAKRSVFQDPIFARLTIEGKPAVTIFPTPYKDGKRYGIFRPGTPFEQIFEVH